MCFVKYRNEWELEIIFGLQGKVVKRGEKDMVVWMGSRNHVFSLLFILC